MMKLSRSVLAGFVVTALFATLSLQADESPKPPTETKEEEGSFEQFLFDEVIPAFGGLEKMLIENIPRFDFLTTSDSAFIPLSCNFDIGLQQLRPIQTKVIDINGHRKIEGSVEGGGERKLNLHAECGEESSRLDVQDYKVSFFITDIEGESSTYPVRLKFLKQEALDSLFRGLEARVQIIDINGYVLKSVNGEMIPYDESMDQYKSSSKQYKMPVEVWVANPMTRAKLPKKDSGLTHITLEKLNVKQVIQIDGHAYISLPVPVNYEKQFKETHIKVKGPIYTLENGEMIRAVRIHNLEE